MLASGHVHGQWKLRPCWYGDLDEANTAARGMRMPSRVFVRNPRYAGSSAIRRRASSPLNGAQKNSLRLLRSSAHGLVRPADASGARSVLRRYACLPRVRGSARAVPQLRQGEARAAGLPGRQPVLYQTFRALRGPTLPCDHDQGDWPRNSISTGTRSRRSRSSTCRRNWPRRARPVRR